MHYQIKFQTKSVLFYIIFLTTLGGLQSVYATSKPLSANRDLPQILAQKKLIVAIPKQTAPIFLTKNDQGKSVGFAISMAKDIGKKLGVKIVFNHDANTYDDLVKLLNENKADVVIGDLSKTTNRAKHIVYTNTYIRLHPSFFINRSWEAKQHQSPLHRFDILKAVNSSKCRVGILAGTSYSEYANTIIPKAIITQANSEVQLLQQLKNGKIDVIFYDDLQTKKLILDNFTRVLKYKTLVLQDYNDLIGFATPQNRRLLRHWLNLYLELNGRVYTANDLLKYAKNSNTKTKEGEHATQPLH